MSGGRTELKPRKKIMTEHEHDDRSGIESGSVIRFFSTAAVVAAVLMLLVTVGMGMSTAAAQPNVVEEISETFGGDDEFGADRAWSVVETSDGGLAFAGTEFSFSPDGGNGWLVKTDGNGNTVINETYGGERTDRLYSIAKTSDGGFVMAGETGSFGSEFGSEIWLLKTDANGEVEFNEAFGGDEKEVAYSVTETSDGGFALAGERGLGPDTEAFLIKTDENGEVEFGETFSVGDGDNGNRANSLTETSDGGFVMAGTTSYPDISEGSDVFLIKTDEDGNEEFTETYGDRDEFDFGEEVIETSDGGLAVAGSVSTFGSGTTDAWLLKTDENGNEEFSDTYGGEDGDFAQSVVELSDGGFALAGDTVTGGSGTRDAWLIKTDGNGNEEFDETFNWVALDTAESIVETSDNGVGMAGRSVTDGPVAGDAWLLKLSLGESETEPSNFEVSIDSTNSPVEEGDTLTVTGTIENTGVESDTQTITATVSGIGSVTETVSVDGGDSRTETVSVPTGIGDAGTYTLTVSSDDDSDTTEVTVQSDSDGDVVDDYRNEQGIVDTGGLQDAIADFIQGNIGTGDLQEVISAFIAA